MNNVPSSAILTVIAIVAAVIVSAFAFAAYQTSHDSADTANGKANTTMNNAAEMRIMQYDHNEYRGARVREIIPGLASDQISVVVVNNTDSKSKDDNAMAFGYSLYINAKLMGDSADGKFMYNPAGAVMRYELGNSRGQNDMADSSRMKDWVHDESKYRASVVRSASNDSIVAVIFDESGQYISSARSGSEAGGNVRGATNELAQSYSFVLAKNGSVVRNGVETGLVAISSNDAAANGFASTANGYVNEGSLSNSSESVKIKLPTATANGATFKYWFVTGPGLNGVQKHPGDVIPIAYASLASYSGVGSGRYTAQAVFEQLVSHITYKEVIGDSTTETNVTNTYKDRGYKTEIAGTDATVSFTPPSRSAQSDTYKFTGWTYTFGTTKVTTRHPGTVTLKIPGGTDVTMVAHFAPSHKITYRNVDGATNNNPTTFAEGDTILLKNPTKAGETFVKWQEGDTIPATATVDQTRTAVWANHTVRVTFDPNGGTFETPSQQTMTFAYDPASRGAVIDSSPAVTKKGYEAPIWKDSKGNVLDPGTTVLTSDTTYIADWGKELTYSVAVHMTEPDGSHATKTFPNIPYSRNINATLNAETTIPPKYTLTGWSSQADGKGVRYGTKSTISGLSSSQGATINLYAMYTGKSYTITYHSNDGINNIRQQEYTYGEKFSLWATNWTRSRYKFMGWATSSTAQTVKFAAGQEFNSTSDMDVLSKSGPADLYAVWADNGQSITFDPHGGYFTARTDDKSTAKDESKDTSPMVVNYASTETTYGTKLPAVTKPGFVFQGWWTTADDYGTRITATTKLPAGNKELYAHWDTTQFAVTLHLNGGIYNGDDSEPVRKTFTAETPAFTIGAPTKGRYAFAGWATKDANARFNGDAAEFKDNRPEVVIDTLKLQQKISVPQGSVAGQEYYAEWFTTVEFDVNGGNPYGPRTIRKLPNQTVKVPSEIPFRNGYTFLGWSENKKAEKPDYISEDNPVLATDVNHQYTGAKTAISGTESMVLYAVWLRSSNVYDQDDVFTVPADGYYKLEAFGAQGANAGGKGGYASGTYFLKEGTKLYLKVGTEGQYLVVDDDAAAQALTQDDMGGKHGGTGTVTMPGTDGPKSQLSGGGYSSISLRDGELTEIGQGHEDSILVVAGGGGASYNGAKGGDGGSDSAADGNGVGTFYRK